MTNNNGNHLTAEKQFQEGAANSSVQFIANNKLEPEIGFSSFALRFFQTASDIPSWWSPARDVWLRKLLHNDSMISGIVYGECARVKNMPYKLESSKENQASERRISKYQDMLDLCQFGQGIRQFMHKFTLDYLTQDNGVFVELIGKGGDRKTERYLDKADIQSFALLDAGQMWRTYDPEYPAIYVNPFTGEHHIMHYTRLFFTANFEQNFELARGIGICALSRAYEAARLILATNTYIYEKVTGQSADIGFVKGMTTKQLSNALYAANEADLAKGTLVWKGINLIGQQNLGAGGVEPGIEIVSLKGLPDGFNRRDETEVTVAIIANAFGVDVREIWRANSTGETKADAEIQDEKSQGKGRADAMQILEDFLSKRVFSDDISFLFDKQNDKADERQALISQARANTRQTQLASGEINLEESRIMAAKAGDIPPEFLERQITADDTVNINADGKPAVNQNEGEIIDNQDDVQEPETEQGAKAYGATRTNFNANLLTLCQLGIVDAIGKNTFSARAKSLVRQTHELAFIDGLRAGAGNQTVMPDADEMVALKSLTSFQVSRVTDLANFIYDDPKPSFTEVLARVNLWVNKGLDTTYNEGLMLGRGNKMLRWRVGATEKSCKTCQAANGQIHRAKEWKRANVVPKSDNLICNGFQCLCEFEETTERAKGRLSRIPTKGKLAQQIKALIFGKHQNHSH